MSRNLRKKLVHFPADCNHFIFLFILHIVSPNKVYWTLSCCNYGDIGVNGNVMCEMVFRGGEMYCLSLQQQQQFLPWDSFQTKKTDSASSTPNQTFVICRVWICFKDFCEGHQDEGFPQLAGPTVMFLNFPQRFSSSSRRECAKITGCTLFVKTSMPDWSHVPLQLLHALSIWSLADGFHMRHRMLLQLLDCTIHFLRVCNQVLQGFAWLRHDKIYKFFLASFLLDAGLYKKFSVSFDIFGHNKISNL